MKAGGRRFYLVTGGAGFLGSALVRRLVADGHRVRVLDDCSRGSPRRLADVLDRIELIPGDIRDAATVRGAVAGVDSIAHLAFVNGTEFFYTKPDLVLDVGVRGMINLIDAGAACGTAELILASSSEVYQTPPSVPTDETVPCSIPDVLNPRYSYGGGKLISELMALHWAAKHFGRVVVFRPHNVYGPDMGREHVVPQFALRMARLADGQPRGVIDFPIQGSGQETRAFVHVEDFTEGVLRVMRSGEHLGIYHVGTDVETTIADLAREVARCFGRELRLVPGPLQAGGTPRRCPDISRVRALGFAPRIGLRQGLEQTVRWYRELEEVRQQVA